VATTGGFGIGQEMGVATRGSGREPINAWLPLYIHAEHWEIIKISLRQILGYVFVYFNTNKEKRKARQEKETRKRNRCGHS
jgi:hypothetical protein